MRLLIVLLLVFALVLAGITMYLQPNDFTACVEKPNAAKNCEPADAIVVVSGGDTRARTLAGIQLYNDDWADKLVFSGAAQDKTGPSNAAAMQALAIDSGIPANNIFIDEEALNTQQNAANTKEIFMQNDIDNVILVTSGYHQRRADLEFEKIAGDVAIRNHPVIQDSDWGWYWWITPRGWWLAGGELAKIGAYYVGAGV